LVTQPSTPVLITVSGPDKPGVSSVLFAVLARHGVDILDVEQVVIRGQLVLGVLVGSDRDPEGLQEAVEQAMATVAMTVTVEVGADPLSPARLGSSHVLIVLGRPVTARAFAEVARRLAALDTNIDSIRRVADYPVTGLELRVSVAQDNPQSDADLRTALADVSARIGLDIAVEREGLTRRAKRLVVFDVDSTLIQGEVIEMLAARAGCEDQVRAVTEAAMRGELDFAQSLVQRVATLAGVPHTVFADVLAEVRFSPGAPELVAALRAAGWEVALVSGGFAEIVAPLAEQLGITRFRANRLEVADGVLTGRTQGPVIDRAGKEQALRDFANELGIAMEDTVAIGDGANDLDMMRAAGLGIAFNAKPIVQQQADAAINGPRLDAALELIGL
jgi:phosphoserine phosphatase